MRASSPEPSSGAPSRKQRVLLAIVLVPLVTAAGLEVGARIITRLRGRAWDAAAARADIEVVCQALSRKTFIPGGLQDEDRARERPGTQILQPFTGWEHLSTQDLIVQGSEYYANPRSERAFDICILGGSVAQTFAEKGRARLVELLQKDERLGGREVLVHNYACAGYKQPQPLMFLSYLFALGHKPDLVIELDGFNDSALSWANRTAGVQPAYPYLPFWSNVMQGLRPDWEWAEHIHETHAAQERAAEFGEWLMRSQLWRSCFLGRIGMSRLERLREEYVAAYHGLNAYIESRPKDAELKGPRFSADEVVVARSIIRVWEESSLGMQGACSARGIAYLHVLQPTLSDRGSKPLTEKEIQGGSADPAWIEGVQRLYPYLRDAGDRLSKRGVSFFDASGIFRSNPEELYIDVCHLNQRGNELMADAIAVAVIAALARAR